VSGSPNTKDRWQDYGEAAEDLMITLDSEGYTVFSCMGEDDYEEVQRCVINWLIKFRAGEVVDNGGLV
jgi:hypothetical protein